MLLGSTAFDSFSAIPVWRDFVDSAADGPWTATLLKTAALAVFVLVVAGTFTAAAMATAGVDRQRRRELPGLMAHSLIPIVVGLLFIGALVVLASATQLGPFIYTIF